MTDARFLILRGSVAGPVYLARPEGPDEADVWTEDRGEARRFADRADAEAWQEACVCGGVAVAVVPDLT